VPIFPFFSFADIWSPVFLIAVLAVILLYALVTGPWRRRFPGSEPVPAKRQAAFVIGVLLLYLAQGGPLSLLAHIMFTFHMISMAVSYMFAAPLIIYGIPAWLWRWAFDRPFWRPFRFLMNPLICLVLFLLLFSLYHVPEVHDGIMVRYTLHAAFYAVLFVAAVMFWWHVASPVPEWNRLTPLRKLAYVFMSGVLLTPACALIIFAGEPMYAVYSDPLVWVRAIGYCVAGDTTTLLRETGGPAFLSLLAPLEDQQLGGIVMKLLQEGVNVIALYVIFKAWYRSERDRDGEETDGQIPGGVPGGLGRLAGGEP